MIRALLDANVVASMFPAHQGVLLELSEMLFARSFEGVISPYILGEVERAWLKPYWRERLTASTRRDLLLLVREELTIIDEPAMVPGAASHAEDDFVLAAAAGTRADVLVTGDRELLDLHQYEDVLIYSPSHFVHVMKITEWPPRRTATGQQ